MKEKYQKRRMLKLLATAVLNYEMVKCFCLCLIGSCQCSLRSFNSTLCFLWKILDGDLFSSAFWIFVVLQWAQNSLTAYYY